MTRNYMHQWRINRLLANDPCECGGGPRVAYEKGCIRCEEMDRQRYNNERMVAVVRRKLPRYDAVSVAELAEDCAATTEQVATTLYHLVDLGEAEAVGAGNTTEYRLTAERKRRVA